MSHAIRRLSSTGLLALSLATLAALPASAWAGPLDERAADAHFKAIASGDVDTIMTAYGSEPFVEWVGGPLDGRYVGKDAVQAMWTKFMAVNDQQPRTVQRSAIVQNANPKGASLTANVDYIGKTTVRVHHTVVYRDGRLITEVWQIDPTAPMTP